MFFTQLRNTKGVIDLFSIMVGVVITGILASIATASVLYMVPTIRDDAAKQQIAAVRTAQTNYQQSTGLYGDASALVNNGYLQANSSVIVSLKSAGACYVAGVTSETGKIFYITSDNTNVGVVEAGGNINSVGCNASSGVVAAVAPAFYTGDYVAGADAYYNIDGNGKLWAWGSNAFGQLGNGTTTTAYAPVAVTTPANVKFAQISAGTGTAIAITTDGKLYAWGKNTNGQVGDGTIVNKNVPTAIATSLTFRVAKAGDINSIGVTTAGALYTWGSDDATNGSVGNGATASGNVTTPTKLTVNQNGNEVKFTTVSLGYRNAYAIDTSKHLWAWGYNTGGGVGIGNVSTANVNAPTAISITKTYKAIQGGNSNAIALDTADKIWTWGTNTYGQLGNGTTTLTSSPAQVGTASYREIAADGSVTHVLALDVNGKLWAWGANASGQLGNGATAASQTTPLNITPTVTYLQISSGGAFSAALDSSGTLVGWGSKANGSFATGANATGPQTTPTPVTVPSTY